MFLAANVHPFNSEKMGNMLFTNARRRWSDKSALKGRRSPEITGILKILHVKPFIGCTNSSVDIINGDNLFDMCGGSFGLKFSCA